MKFAAIERQLKAYPLQWMCRKLGVSRAGYYAWKKRPETKRCRDDRALAVEIKAFHRASRATYGSPRLLHDIRETGRRIGRNRIIRIMREHGLSGRRKRRYVHTTNSNHQFPIAENVLQRDFKAEAPNQKWVGDITYLRTHEGWLYLALLVDLYSRKIVGWAVSDSMHTDLPLRALRMALQHPPFALQRNLSLARQHASTLFKRPPRPHNRRILERADPHFGSCQAI